MKRLIALVLICALLGGCAASGILRERYGVTAFADMEYTRPDLDALAESCRDACDLAAASDDADEVLEAVWDFYDVYDDYSANYDLAYLHYHADLGDIYWQEEYDFCAENAAQPDQYLEDLYCALARSSLRGALEEEYFGEGFFLDYDGGGMYDETLLDYLEREQELIGEYYALSDQADAGYFSEEHLDACAIPMADILARLVELRREMAAYLGYDSYTDFAWDYYYYRDYTPAQASAYLEDIRTGLVPLYENMNAMDIWGPYDEYCSESETFGYVRETAKNLGGVVWDAFAAMDLGDLYDIRVSEKKSGLSFELFFDKYYTPYVFLSPAGTRYDCLTFAHEFGHFVNDYAAGGSWAGTDVLEIFSQGMEYLSLSYGNAEEDLIAMKLADSLCTYVEQAAYAAFELAVYELEGEVTGPELLELYADIGTAYGFNSMDWDPRDMVTVPHFFGNPMYIISYVVSNDAAMQIYELELESKGAGSGVYMENLTTEESYFLAFLQEAGLESPFGRINGVRALMAEHFG